MMERLSKHNAKFRWSEDGKTNQNEISVRMTVGKIPMVRSVVSAESPYFSMVSGGGGESSGEAYSSPLFQRKRIAIDWQKR